MNDLIAIYVRYNLSVQRIKSNSWINTIQENKDLSVAKESLEKEIDEYDEQERKV